MFVENLPNSWHSGRMPIHRVAVVAVPHVQPFELGIAWEGFGIDRSEEGIPNYDCSLVSMTPRVTTGAGWTINTPHRLDHAADADLVVVPAYQRAQGAGLGVEKIEPILELLRHTVERGATVMSFCSGAFILGAAGLLDPLALRRRTGRAAPGGAYRSERAVRLRRTRAHLGGNGGRT
jgi:transcriptional regulator GlxA family with amidase domain